MATKQIRVCVLACSYEGSDSALKTYEGNLVQTPQHYFNEADQTRYVFTLELLKKATAYRTIRQLVNSGEYDVFYNQCDGAKDEDRAGVEVVQALEEFHAPFTGAIAKYYEMSKPDMKLVAHYYKIHTAQHATVGLFDDVATACAHMRFPMIVKHISGYSSVGMDRSCKVVNTEQLQLRVKRFVEEYQFAHIEEFIAGDEATVLVCGDATQPDGIRVFHPVCIDFPAGEDFKHFELKWASYEGMHWRRMANDDPALPDVIDISRRAFKRMMGGIGYGRVDIRIDRSDNNRVVFLEINPNCGIMYPPGEEGSADWVLKLSTDMTHRMFAELQIAEAIRRRDETLPLYVRKYHPIRGYHLSAARHINSGTIVLRNECEPVRLCTRQHALSNFAGDDLDDFIHHAWPIGKDKHYYALWDHDPAQWRSFNHSCSPNMAFAANGSLDVCALRDINAGEELTMDYRTFMDDIMPSFECYCGSSDCAGRITHSTKQETVTRTKIDERTGELARCSFPLNAMLQSL